MDEALEILASDQRVRLRAMPRLKLLLERERAHHVFFSNLLDALSFQSAPPLDLNQPPNDFWRNVFLPTELPWKSFQESLLWHFVAAIALWGFSQGWISRPQPHVRETYRAAGAIYYAPSKAFPAARSSPPRIKKETPAPTRASAKAAAPMKVAPEQRQSAGIVVPPDLKAAIGARAPNLASAAELPAVPLSATGSGRQLPGMAAAVAPPPPEVAGGGKRLGSLQNSVVAPPVAMAGVEGGRSLRGPGAGVVAPPPTLEASARGLGSLGGGSARVVAPPPQLSNDGLHSGSHGVAGLGAGGAVVPPPPAIAHSGRAGAVSAPGLAAVPPPPALQGSGAAGGGGRGTTVSGMGAPVVPPPPAVQSRGGVWAALGSLFSSGDSNKVVPPPPGLKDGVGQLGSGRGPGSLAGQGSSAVVAPPPSVQGGGTGTGRVTSLASGGSAVVPPPPSVAGAGAGGKSGRGFGGSLPGDGDGVVPPPPSLSAANGGFGTGSGKGSGSGRGSSLTGGAAQVVPPPPSVNGGGNGEGGNGGGGNGGGRLNSLGTGGNGVVPPPPSVAGVGNSGTGTGGAGRGENMIAGGTGVVAPPPSLAGAGNGGRGGGGFGNGRGAGVPGGDLDGVAPPGGGGSGSVSTGPLEPMEPLDVPQNQTSAVPPPPSAEDLGVRLIPIPGASARSSFFNNYEAIIAERTISGNKMEYIKLVYISLPYQKRLEEYDWTTTKIYKLRAIQDPACDESLMQMMFPEGGGLMDSEAQAAADSLVARVGDKNTKLRCYKTTADDFARAIQRGR